MPGFLLIEQSDYELKQQLAKGGGGTVHLAEITNTSLLEKYGTKRCIIKTLNVSPGDDPKKLEEAMGLFCQEVSMMWFFRGHKNLASVLGYHLQPFAIMMRYFEMGSLATLIHKTKLEFTTSLIRKFMLDIGTGLMEMHNRGVTHNDIKPDNVLVDKSFETPGGELRCVLTDFGISQIINAKKANVVATFKMIKIRGASAVYASPETFLRFIEGESSDIDTPASYKASDVYSYAVTGYEIITRRKAWKGYRSREEIQAKVLAGDRPEFSEKILAQSIDSPALSQFIRIIEQCWLQDPGQRPTMDIVLEMLDEVPETLSVPSELSNRTLPRPTSNSLNRPSSLNRQRNSNSNSGSSGSKKHT